MNYNLYLMGAPMKSDFKNLKKIFEQANEQLLNLDMNLFELQVSEQTICGALAIRLHDILKDTQYSKYYVDIEYNRNRGGKFKRIFKSIQGPGEEIIRIKADLIVHSRGECVERDNLLALEMKKSYRPKKEKDADRSRLKCLTKDSFNHEWSFDGTELPEHVCRYAIGIYYEIDFDKRTISLEYYRKGEFYTDDEICY